MNVTNFSISGNSNDTLIGGARITVKYHEEAASPVVFLDAEMISPVRVRSVEVSVIYTAYVGSVEIANPSGHFFAMDKDSCQILEREL